MLLYWSVLPVWWWVTAPPPVAHGAVGFGAAPLQHVPEVLRSTGGAPPTLTRLILDQVRQGEGHHHAEIVNIMLALATCES